MHADSAPASYVYDGLGRRALKRAGGGASTRFAYGLGGELLAEAAYGQDGQLQPGAARTEHVWLDGMPIAVVKGGQIRYVHADPLGTPRLITDAGGIPVWRWGGGPFGDAPADADPDGDGVPFTYNLRFPGQYFDAETGLHYNMARYYDPATGRYREADPIGLGGGVNLYGYVGGDPVDWVDPFGLSEADVKRIQDVFNSTIINMTKDNARNENPYINNLSSSANLVSGGLIGHPYLGCWDQEYVTTRQLENQVYDDKWIFTPQSSVVHHWGEATSSNPKDPVIVYDPWRGTITIKPSSSKQ